MTLIQTKTTRQYSNPIPGTNTILIFKNTIPSPTFACHYVNPPGSYLIGGHSVTEEKNCPALRHRVQKWQIGEHPVTGGLIGKFASMPSQ